MLPFNLVQVVTIAGITLRLDSASNVLDLSGHKLTSAQLADLVEVLEHVHASDLTSFPAPPPEPPPSLPNEEVVLEELG